MKLVVVAGRPRTGGSAVAEVLHTLGVPMGTRFYAPGPPSYRCEWEDCDLCEMLAAAQTESRMTSRTLPAIVSAGFRNYLRMRLVSAAEVARKTGTRVEAFGFKTPLVLPYMPELRSVAEDEGLRLLLVRADRNHSDASASVRRCLEHEPDALPEGMTMLANCGALEREQQYASVVSYDDLRRWPEAAIGALVRGLGLDVTDERLADAASRVDRVEDGACLSDGP